MNIMWRNFSVAVEESRYTGKFLSRLCDEIVQKCLEELKTNRSDEAVEIEEIAAEFEEQRLLFQLGLKDENKYLREFSVPVLYLGKEGDQEVFEYLEGWEAGIEIEWSDSFVSWPTLLPQAGKPHEKLCGNQTELQITGEPVFDVPARWQAYRN